MRFSNKASFLLVFLALGLLFLLRWFLFNYFDKSNDHSHFENSNLISSIGTPISKNKLQLTYEHSNRGNVETISPSSDRLSLPPNVSQISPPNELEKNPGIEQMIVNFAKRKTQTGSANFDIHGFPPNVSQVSEPSDISEGIPLQKLISNFEKEQKLAEAARIISPFLSFSPSEIPSDHH